MLLDTIQPTGNARIELDAGQTLAAGAAYNLPEHVNTVSMPNEITIDKHIRFQDMVFTREVPETLSWLKALRCLAAVAAHGSTMRAADAVNLSQPAVTRAVLEIERQIGQRLFDRNGRGMTATALGLRVATRIERLQDQLRLGASEAQLLSQVPVRFVPTAERFAASVVPASLRALLAVAVLASESRAAESLGIRQPAVHRSLSALENSCGTVLYSKSVHGTRLTESGHALLRRVKLAMAELHAMEAEVAASRGQVRGRVIVGALPLSVHFILPQAVAAAMHKHANIGITVIDGTYESLMRQLADADVDLVIGALRSVPPSGVTQFRLFSDELAIVARTGHPCLESGLQSLHQLRQWPWVVPLPNTPARATLDRIFADQGLASPCDRLQATSALFTRATVASSDCLALASWGQARQDEVAGILRIVPVVTSVTSREIGLAFRSNDQPAPDLQALVDALCEQSAVLCHQKKP